MKNKIVLITTGQPSTNPRAVKEATVLADLGYDVIFIYNYWTGWALFFDKKIIHENPNIHWIMVGGSPLKEKTKYYASRIRHKYFRLLNKISPTNINIARHAISRGFYSLAKMASGIKADLYIAHNLGALPAAASAAKKNNAIYAFDAEDYHRGQELAYSIEQKRTILLENRYLPNTSYVTASSPLIAERYNQHYNRPVTVISNVFSKKYLAEAIRASSKPIKLFWFSQTIGKGRGVEDIILALKEMPVGAFSLTLLGKHDETIKNYFNELGMKGEERLIINFMVPVSSDEIFRIAAQHDIGLALEQPGELNRDLCLTNKIFTYLLAGNAIIVSNTSAQRKFYEENRGVGMLYRSGDIEDMKKLLSQLLENPAMVESMKRNALQAANERYNWETESKKLIAILKTL